MSNITQRFFEPVSNLGQKDIIVDELTNPMVEVLTSLSNFSSQSLYIVDYARKGFLYVSNHPLFLCGYSSLQVLNMGYHFYEKVVPSEDIRILLEINRYGFKFFYNLPVELRTQCHICYNFRLKHLNGKTVLVNHKLSPLRISEKGDMLLALCMVNVAQRGQQPGAVYIEMKNKPVRYNYSFKRKRFIQQDTKTLSDREKQVLSLIVNGFSESKVASTLSISASTVKYHKRRIYQKINVNNLVEAVQFTSFNRLP
jgi:DNA-binding CsgD family transcriptional regulator